MTARIATALFLLSLASCGHAPTKTSRAPAAPVLEHVVRGHLLGIDGHPLALGHVRMFAAAGTVINETSPSTDGSFVLPLPSARIVRLELGADKQKETVYVATEEPPVDVEVRLGDVSTAKVSGGLAGRVAELVRQLDASLHTLEAEAKDAYLSGGPPAMRAVQLHFVTARAPFAVAAHDDRPIVRQVATLAYFALGDFDTPTAEDKALAKKLVSELAPEDPVWAIGDGAIALRIAKQPEVAASVVLRSPSANLVAKILLDELIASKKDIERSRQIIATLKEPRFHGSFEAAFAMRLDPDRGIAAGKAMPFFEVGAVVGDRVEGKLSNKAFEGKPYIIEVWSTSCAPCIAELPKLHEIYARYGAKKLEIMSVSIDEDVAPVAKFRKDKAHPMPWHQGLAGDDKKSDFFKMLGWSDSGAMVPFYVLVDAHGTIVSATPELRMEALPALLERVLGEPAGGG